LATDIVDVALADYPVIKSIVDDTAINFVSGLLGSGRMEQAMTQVVSRLQVFLTSPQKQPVVINLEGAKTTVTQLIQLSGREGQTNFDPNKIPSQITVFDPAKYPSFYHYTVVLTWLSPLAAIGALVLLGWPYVTNRKSYRQVMIIQGVCVTVAGLLALLVGPLFRPVALSSIQSANMRVVVGNLYDAFIATFNQQTMWVIAIGALAVVVSSGLGIYQHYRLKH
jgi:FtsH-binding integral membrane protein